MAKADTDREFVARVRAGDVAAFGELVRRYQDVAVAAALHLLGPSSDLEDVVQEAFIDAYRGLRTFDPERPFGRWLRAIVRNRCRRELRRRARRPQSLDDEQGPVVQPAGGANGLAAEVLEKVEQLAPARQNQPELGPEGGIHGDWSTTRQGGKHAAAWRVETGQHGRGRP